MKKRLFLLTILSLCLLTQSAPGADPQQKELTRTYDPGQVESVRLLNLAGRVLIEGSSGLEIEVEVGDYVYGGQTILATY